jgi:hypothetical protein
MTTFKISDTNEGMGDGICQDFEFGVNVLVP